jgi:hypothetical protein
MTVMEALLIAHVQVPGVAEANLPVLVDDD